jgi:hypothetical protein
MKRLLGLILLLFSFWLIVGGCKTKTITNTSVTKDSTANNSNVSKSKDVKDSTIVTPKVEIRTIIINPCDSNGNLKPFNQTVKNGQGKATIRTVHDSIYIDCDCDATIQRFRSEITAKDSMISSLKTHAIMTSDSKTIEVVKYEMPIWGWALIAALVLLIILLLKQIFL